MALFRKESMTSFESNFTGSPIIKSPVSIVVVSYISILLVLIVIAFFYFGSYTKRVNVNGVILPKGDVVRVYNDNSGIIDSVHVAEGDTVKKGDVLFTIINEKTSNLTNINKESINLIIKKIELTTALIEDSNRILSEKSLSLNVMIASLEQELDLINAALKLNADKQFISDSDYKKHVKLHESKSISTSQLEQAELTVIDSKIKQNEIAHRKNQVLAEIENLKRNLIELPMVMGQERNRMAQDLMALKMQLIAAQSARESQILSPIGGTVATISSLRGKNINRNFLLAVIIPQNSIMEGVLYVSNKSIGFVKRGDQVNVRLDSFPYQKFGYISGRVRHVSNVALLPHEMPEILNNREMLYSVRVELDRDNILAYGNKIPVKPTMTFSAIVMLENRKIYEWILEPLYSITGNYK